VKQGHLFLRSAVLILTAFAPFRAFCAGGDYLNQLPDGAAWLNHLNNDLLPFWTVPAAIGNPAGAFPSTRCDDGSLLDFKNPCPPIAGSAYLMLPERYLVPLSRQTYGYGVAYQLTGDTRYLAWMKAGVDYIRQYAIDPAGGMFTQLDLGTGAQGVERNLRDPQQLGYGLLGLAFYYYLTRDPDVLPSITSIKDYIFSTYYNHPLGAMQWLPGSNEQKQLVADLDQMNTYLVLLTPILPEPYQSEWKQSLTTLSHSILGTFYSPSDNLMFLAANTPQDRDLAFTGVDFGHTSKALWMIRWTGQITGDSGLFNLGTLNGRRHLERAFLAEDGSWAGGVLAGGTVDKNKNWWVYCELDQLSGTLALGDAGAGVHLPQTNQYWFRYFVDHQFGEVWNGVNFGTNTPQRDFPKAWQWKSAYHDFEHALVGYITSQQLLGQPFTLHYAFAGGVDRATTHPYYFSAAIDTVTETVDSAGNRYQAVTFRPAQPASLDVAAPVSAASFLSSPLAAESIAMVTGVNLATTTAQAQTTPFPKSLGGTTVSVRDSTGTARTASLLYVSPRQVNFQIPPGTRSGPATVVVTPSTAVSVAWPIQVASAAPGIFQLNSTALAAANIIRVKDGVTQPLEPVYEVDASNQVVPRPVDLGQDTDLIYLALYATGLRNAQSVGVTVAGQSVPVIYSGPQGSYEGLDQVNAGPVPRSLAGAGKVNVVLVADGQTANPVEFVLR
jgi:uncharacterized protein (TIGR03437 family)